MKDLKDDVDAAVVAPRRLALGRAIRAARGAMSQTEFGRLAGRPQSVVSEWESATRAPGLELLSRLEEGLGVPLGTLAAEAGYFSEDVFGSASDVVACRACDSLDEASASVSAAELLGFEARLASEVDNGTRTWRVEVVRRSVADGTR
ncbi:MAG: helix-turn-helix protein [Acidimicrobiales bacterium]|nr:helix-turn-helix protein [Acidimicrobiales bacterium]